MENERLTHQLLFHYQADAEIDPVCFEGNVDFSYLDKKNASIYKTICQGDFDFLASSVSHIRNLGHF